MLTLAEMTEVNDHDGEGLICPSCSHENTHVDAVVVGVRREDEGPVVMAIDLTSGLMTHYETKDGSPRRSWVSLVMWCEYCRETSSITLAQHKGYTLTDVEPLPVEDRPFPLASPDDEMFDASERADAL